jgi:hypothetical protein
LYSPSQSSLALFHVCLDVKLRKEIDQGDNIDACDDNGEGFPTVTQAGDCTLRALADIIMVLARV